MAEKEGNEDFTTLLIKWYLEQKKTSKNLIESDKEDSNARNRV